jgi:hypothetical protein
MTKFLRRLPRTAAAALRARLTQRLCRRPGSRRHFQQGASEKQNESRGFAERVGARPDGANPARHIERFREEPRERMLSADELARLGDALDGSEESPSSSP